MGDIFFTPPRGGGHIHWFSGGKPAQYYSSKAGGNVENLKMCRGSVRNTPFPPVVKI